MTKRIIALLLALILTVGLLPTVALAEGAPKEDGQTAASGVSTVQSGTDSDNNTDNPVHVIKTFTPGKNGEFGSLTLEAYVTNPLQVVTETVPLDIVLVLDQSGSMGYCINCDTEFKEDKWVEDTCNNTAATFEYKAISRNNAHHDTTYYIVSDGQYYKVNWCNGYHPGLFNNHYSGWYYNGRYGHTRVDSTTTLYERVMMTGHKHRLDALTEALNTFVNSVVANGGDHNVAVVGYAGTGNSYSDKNSTKNSELLTGTKLATGSKYSDNQYRYYPQKDLSKDPINGKNYGNLTENSPEYSNALQSMKKTEEGVANVRAAINALTANGATQTYAGMDMAKNILAKAKTANSNRQQVVILFTDGDTNSSQQSVYELADGMKKSGVLIYTVGLFKDADQTKGTTSNKKDDYNLFLNKVSNNSIEYMNQGSKPRTKTDKTYYLPAQNAASLSAVFEQISKEVSKLDLKVDSNAVLQDTLSGYFTFEADDNAKGSITVQTAAFEGIDANGQMKWGTPENATGTTVEVTGKKITVTGFDYGSSENLVTVHETGDPKYTGNKLIVTIPIKPDTTSDVTWKAGSNLYDTNVTEGDKAGLSGYGYKDKPGTLSTTLPTSPKAPVTGYTVTYSYTTDSQYTGAALPTGGTYINGQKHDVAPGLADVTGYRFKGWYTDEACTVSAGDEVVINGKNVILYGRYVKNTTKVNLTDYIQKTLTATSLPSGYKETFKAKITGTPITVEGGLEITTPEFSAAGTQNFTGAAEVELTYGQTYTFTVTETAPGTVTTGLTYDTAGHDFALKVSDTGDVQLGTIDSTGAFVAAAADSKVTIENTYTPGESSFSLAQKFQKVLNSNTANVPNKSFELTITGTSDNTDKSTITGTAAVGTLTASGTSYTGSANFTFKKGTEAVSALTFPAAGTYIYKVQETNSNVAGMSYDTTEYTLTVVVADNAGALEITSAIVTKPGTSDTPVVVTDLKTSFLTIENTFTAAELPLDPTPDPTTGEVTPKIVKKLRVTSGSAAPTADLPFTVAVYEGNAVDEAKRVATGTATIPANSPDETTVNFTGLATLVFPEAGSFTYTIHEDTGSTSGVRYDGYLYTMTVDVTKNTSDNSLSATCSFSYPLGEETVVANSITITNTYTEPKNAQVTNKEVVVTQPEDALKTAVDAFENASEVTVLYPTGNGTTSNSLEVPYGTTEATLLYKITVFAGTKTYYEFDDVSAKFVYAEHANVAQEGNTFKVTFENGEEYAYVYVAVTHDLNFDGDICEVDNTVFDQTAKTTVKEKDPNSVTVDFSRYVYKKLTVTGDKAFTGATFEAVLDGEWHDLPAARSLEDASAIATYAHATPGAAQLHKTLTVSFDANDDLTQNKAFTGSITFNAEGVYTYTLKEIIPEGATGYDTSEFHLVVTVKANGNGQLEATVPMWFNDELMPLETGILFSNTIDTGKDDYYPIIIPTIINKDTGMLNKTDHFAYVIGYPDGTVHPNGQITRAEVATIFFRLLRDEVRDGAFTTSNSYSDVAYGKWYNNPISTMSALGIITGYPDGTFKPNKPITRAEFAAIAARFDETQSGKSATFSDVIGHWAAKEIGIAYYNDWIKGYPDGTFKPDQNITRAEAMTLINRVLERKPESPADLLTNMNKWTDNMDTSKWYYLDVQEATNSHGYTRKTFNYELWRQMLPDPDWSRYER